jgi:hypothetical protein
MPDSEHSIAPDTEEVDRMLQTKPTRPTTETANEAPIAAHDTLRAPGQLPDAAAPAYFERRFGQRFPDVRIHRDRRAADSTRAVE